MLGDPDEMAKMENTREEAKRAKTEKAEKRKLDAAQKLKVCLAEPKPVPASEVARISEPVYLKWNPVLSFSTDDSITS